MNNSPTAKGQPDSNDRDGPPRVTLGKNRSAETEKERTFEQLYAEYGGRILNLLFRFTSREQVARDLLQDVFVKVYQEYETFRQHSQIYTWIYRIAVNHALNYLKRERRTIWLDLMDESVSQLLRQEKIDIPGLGSPDVVRPDDVYERAEIELLVQRAKDSLPPKYRVPLVLFVDEQMSYAEIGRILDISLSAVETRIHRARKMLIKKLGPLIK